MKDFLEIAKQAALASGEIQMQHYRREKQIEFKGEINLVTQVDKMCEREIVSRLQGAFPEHDILAEEGTGTRKDSPYKWVIDPLDGTTNYAHGYPLFCTSIGLEYKGEIVVGVVYEPNLNELFLAEKGQGATCNGERIRVSKTSKLDEALLATGFAYNVKQVKNNNLDHFSNFILNARAVRRDGVAAADLCYLAMGRFDGFWELELQPWDLAAGFLMVEEAGGIVTDFRYKPFNIYMKEVLASNSLIHKEMTRVLRLE